MRLVRLALVFLVLTTGCRTQGLLFKEDERLDITAPAQRTEVELPVRLAWQSRELPERFASYGVFVDTVPPPVGKDLYHLFRREPTCKRELGCPRPDQLAQRGIYITKDATILLPGIARREGVSKGLEDLHEAVVVLLDTGGTRILESAARVEFTISR